MNNCFSKFTIQIWICSRSVCGLGWTSAHYPGGKHKGPEGYTPIDKTVGRERRGEDGHMINLNLLFVSTRCYLQGCTLRKTELSHVL